MHRNARQLISSTADAHFGARLHGVRSFIASDFLKIIVPFDNTTPIYLVNLLWKLGMWLELDSELHYFSMFHG